MRVGIIRMLQRIVVTIRMQYVNYATIFTNAAMEIKQNNG